jgi:hypothetical protein
MALPLLHLHDPNLNRTITNLKTPTGAANITPDTTPYTDGGIVREGAEGDQGDGKYSSGRGGAANIGGAPLAAGEVAKAPHDSDMVPETAMRLEQKESHHVGRGGAGNEAHVHVKKEGKEGGLLGKVKGIFSSSK